MNSAPSPEFKVLKKIPSKSLKKEIAIVNNLCPLFENWNSVFDKNTSYHEPIRKGNFGEICELNFKLRDNGRKKVSYFGALLPLDNIIYLR